MQNIYMRKKVFLIKVLFVTVISFYRKTARINEFAKRNLAATQKAPKLIFILLNQVSFFIFFLLFEMYFGYGTMNNEYIIFFLLIDRR